MTYKNPTWIERNGEFICALIGLTTILFAANMIVAALIAGLLA
jgi:hypothetical protein